MPISRLLLQLARSHAADACALTGAIAVLRGVWLIYSPASYILGGLVLAALGLGLARAEGRWRVTP